MDVSVGVDVRPLAYARALVFLCMSLCMCVWV